MQNQSKGVSRGLRDHFVNFGTPFISREWLKLETSNLACTLITGDIIVKMQNWVKGVARGSRDHFGKFWDLFISRKRYKLGTSNLARRLIVRGTIVKDAKFGQRGC